MPVGVDLGPGAIGPLLQHQMATSTSTTIRAAAAAGGGGRGATTVVTATELGMEVGDRREMEVQPMCDWRSFWSYGLILVLLLCAVIYVTVISKKRQPEAWLMTLWRVLLVVLPIYLVLRIAFDLYRHRLAQQLAAANLHAVALANAAADAAAAAAAAAAGRSAAVGSASFPHQHQHQHRGEVIITRAGNRLLVLQRPVA
ncbi:hypothetical protein VOLCADRAFT_99017 [Volvox carteri f. nagariensis]|uniref:Uncharacterized protein n=1 Tax=Volvox carteri f. nagariensis TaxID=3068 RepID=D8UGU4_VOLCA|nr:uncharacterized protein VOLCADRAFT_99017 [Volvox carteri f. nagariensis]EFJ41011.1 hypothetical protein VOLCADRAFT_99017 [Volvox carteri f. nagariensis]|eukprot:XP_002957875.1 hypothetical protein VOLCADRAFT_99017 [Volvox carteri f. nagariensis]